MTPYYDDGGVTIYHADALDLLRSLPDASVQLIATDPPYFGVKDEAWDNAWPNERAFLRWIGALCKEWRRVLAPNGSLYVFASPDMAHGVERVVRRHFRVLNVIRWEKDDGWHKKAEKEAMRSFLSPWEAVVFAEQGNGDAWADGEAGYTEKCEMAKVSVFGEYLRAEMRRAGVTNRAIAALFPSRSGGLTGCVSNWLLGLNCPTAEQYEAIRRLLNDTGGDYLRREYEDLRREYEDLRREYEDLRRPFFATPNTPYTDVWDFATVKTYPGKHPCEKPLALMEHIVRTSSRPGDVVLDAFCGSGATAEAARNLGRRAIVGDSDAHWCHYTAVRLSQGVLDLGAA